ncbi:unnamed protein product [Cochlearia groenlandica]
MSVSSNIVKDNSRELLSEEEYFDDEIKSSIERDNEFSFTSIRILMVDKDTNSLCLLKNIMAQFAYQVKSYEKGEEAMDFLMKSKHEIDLVLWDLHVPDINGLDALNIVSKKLDLPFIIMSHDYDKEVVMKSIKNGACDFLLKPVSKEVVAVLWRHVYNHKRKSNSGLVKPNESDPVQSHPQEEEEEDGLGQEQDDQSNYEDSSDQREDRSFSKKPRMTWTPQLHQCFERAVDRIGSIEKAVPKQILRYMQEEMNIEGLTRNNVASHLQKYRLNAEKNPKASHETGGEGSSWLNAMPNTGFADSKPVPNSSITRVPYYMNNDQAAATAPIQYPSSSTYMSMNNHHLMIPNPFANDLFCNDRFLQPPRQQQPQYNPSSLQFPFVGTKQEPRHVSSATDTSSGLIFNPNLPFDLQDNLPGFFI